MAFSHRLCPDVMCIAKESAENFTLCFDLCLHNDEMRVGYVMPRRTQREKLYQCMKEALVRKPVCMIKTVKLAASHADSKAAPDE